MSDEGSPRIVFAEEEEITGRLDLYQTGKEPIFLDQHSSVRLHRLTEERARAAAVAAAHLAQHRRRQQSSFTDSDSDDEAGSMAREQTTETACLTAGGMGLQSISSELMSTEAEPWSLVSSMSLATIAASTAASSCSPQRLADVVGSLAAPRAAAVQRSDERLPDPHPFDAWRPYLPSWDIARSRVWAMAEAAVAQHITVRPEHLAAPTGRSTAPAAVVAISKAATKAALDNATAAAATAAALTVVGTVAGGGGSAADAAPHPSQAPVMTERPSISCLVNLPPGLIFTSPTTPTAAGPSWGASAGYGCTTAATPGTRSFPAALLGPDVVFGVEAVAPSPRTGRLGVSWAPVPTVGALPPARSADEAAAAGKAGPRGGCRSLPPTPAGMGPRALTLLPSRSYHTAGLPRHLLGRQRSGLLSIGGLYTRITTRSSGGAADVGGDVAAAALAAAASAGGSADLNGTVGRAVRALAKRMTRETGSDAQQTGGGGGVGAGDSPVSAPTPFAHFAVDATGNGSGAVDFSSSNGGTLNGAASTALTEKSSVTGSIAGLIAQALTDVLVGPNASACTRHGVGRRVRAVVAGASVAWVAVNVFTVAQALGGVDFSHDLPNSTKAILDLLFNWPNFGEVACELAEIGMAVSLGMAQGPAHDSLDEACEAEELWREGLDHGEEAREPAAEAHESSG
ncbi:hypothetical protein HYH03_006060 [Edaphochlamys debaryana]|uniref:Uncharacterized protein n=1 Tax=Edaphochlamys debaryana TaxID=47281 RepID=A0A836C0K0_9CHLO|nr:hypothetical protein HYH03_006060 [Edaphochlamys debaryana]|eukprot:KAG2495820.1 hypothetical protein HYH03_006060 [Edaphochlamys debaryana]